eukprot:6181378-Pleurochrysis_carterae.AAC.1
MRACVHACVRECAFSCACVRACMRVRVHVAPRLQVGVCDRLFIGPPGVLPAKGEFCVALVDRGAKARAHRRDHAVVASKDQHVLIRQNHKSHNKFPPERGLRSWVSVGSRNAQQKTKHEKTPVVIREE